MSQNETRAKMHCVYVTSRNALWQACMGCGACVAVHTCEWCENIYSYCDTRGVRDVSRICVCDRSCQPIPSNCITVQTATVWRCAVPRRRLKQQNVPSTQYICTHIPFVCTAHSWYSALVAAGSCVVSIMD